MANHIRATSPMNSPALRTMVIGFGNLLLRDEGVGVHLARYLERQGLPPGVEVQEGGTSALDLFLGFACQGKWQEVRRLLILDALDPQAANRLFSEGLAPGQALVWEREDLAAGSGGAGRQAAGVTGRQAADGAGGRVTDAALSLSLHDLDLAFALTLVPRRVEVIMVAIVPRDPYSWGMALTPELKSALPSLARLCRKLLLDA